jgi:hypothetical protein
MNGHERGCRGTTTARHRKVIIIREGDAEGDRIMCAWDDCDRDADYRYVLRVWDTWAPPGPPSQYGFCSERHLRYWANSHRRYGTAA